MSDREITSVRVGPKKKICQQYLEKGSCRREQGNCKYWHICKEFIKGDCDGKCGRSHNFLDEQNGEKTKQLGLDKHSPGSIPKSLKGSRNNTSSKNNTDKDSNSTLSVSSKGTAAVTSLEPSEMKVFDCLCKEYGCSASFAKISKRKDLFPGNLNNVDAWFRKKTGSLLITEDDHGSSGCLLCKGAPLLELQQLLLWRVHEENLLVPARLQGLHH